MKGNVHDILLSKARGERSRVGVHFPSGMAGSCLTSEPSPEHRGPYVPNSELAQSVGGSRWPIPLKSAQWDMPGWLVTAPSSEATGLIFTSVSAALG